MTFATWIAAFVGALTLYAGTRAPQSSVSGNTIVLARLGLPLIGTFLSSLMLALVVAFFANAWGAFFGLWLTVWLVGYALTLLFAGLFAVIDVWAVIVILPLVFYQSALSGAQAPVAASPDWLRWLAEAVPFSAVPQAFRSLLIGGPYGGVIFAALAAAAIGAALVWGGSVLSAGRRKDVSAAHA